MDFNNLIHKGIMENNRWIYMPLSLQIGNIGAEISRLVHWKERNAEDKKDAALDRALELIDLTAYGLQSNKSYPRLREILRLREALCDYAMGTMQYDISGQALIDYCSLFPLISTSV